VCLAVVTSGWLPFPGVQCGILRRNFPARDDNEVLKAAGAGGLDKSIDSIYYDTIGVPITNQQREGGPTETSSCDAIRDVPEALRSSRVMKPAGISTQFYRKYTEAYGIPVISSSEVPDAALSRACYVLRFLLADRADLRQAYYEAFGRVAVVGRRQTLADIPEYRSTTGSGFVVRLPPPADGPLMPARGLGAVQGAPVSTAPEENVLCYDEEPRELDDVLLKTLAVGILNVAAMRVDPAYRAELEAIYAHAMRSGWWANTNAARSPESYFGEGVQSFFNANAYAYPADGFHNDINTRTKLRNYDTSLYSFVQNMFPCANNYIKRCNSRGNEAYQSLLTNCPESGWYSYKRRAAPVK
jgi:hypothetical protein